MTKSEMIAEIAKSHKDTGDALQKCIQMLSDISDPDARVSALMTLTISTTIGDMMSRLSVILCELFAEEDVKDA